MNVKHQIKTIFRKAGYDITQFTPQYSSLARRKKLFESYGINLILDVGANTGHFAIGMRQDLNFVGDIISFEPLSSAFALLKDRSKRDSKWQVINCALGDVDTSTEINIAGNSESSSLLDMLPSHSNAAPTSSYVGKEVIKLKRLDSIFDQFCKGNENVYLKIDTQGYESKVLKGAEKSLDRIGTIHLEMSLVPLYNGELTFEEMHQTLLNKGYILVSLEPGFANNTTGQLLQVDGIYHKA